MVVEVLVGDTDRVTVMYEGVLRVNISKVLFLTPCPSLFSRSRSEVVVLLSSSLSAGYLLVL